MSSEIESGSLNTLKAGTAMYSAKAPDLLTPIPLEFMHKCRRPALQFRQTPQVIWPSADTRSPTS